MDYSQQHYGAGDPDCDMCMGGGWVTYNVPIGHAKYGRVFPCPKCRVEEENTEEAILERIKEAGVEKDGWRVDAEWWPIPGRERIEKAVKEQAKRFEDGDCSGWLTIVSGFGVGKSALGEWLVIQAVRAGIPSMFITAKEFDKAVSDEISGIGNMVERASNVKFLVFDQPDWLWDKGETYRINQARLMLDERYRQRFDTCTVLIVNLAGYDNRYKSGLSAVFNRAEEGKIVISKAAGVREEIGERIEA